MKLPRGVTLLVFLLLVRAPASFAGAEISGSDDFHTVTRSWKTGQRAAAGKFSVANGRLEYITAGTPTANDSATNPWIANSGTYARDWSVRVDVFLGDFEMPSNGSISLTLAVGNAAEESEDLMRIQFRRGGGGERAVLSETFTDRRNLGSTRVPTSSRSCAIQISYVASTHILTASYDEDGPENGYAFVTNTTCDISSGEDSWKMSAKGEFKISLAAQSGRTVIGSGDVYADNFVLSSGGGSRLANAPADTRPQIPPANVSQPPAVAGTPTTNVPPAPGSPAVASVAPALDAPQPAGMPADVGRSRIDVLKVQAPNAIEWALAPLDQAVPGDIRQNLTFLREDLLDEAKQKPGAKPGAYVLGSQICNALLTIFEERSQALAHAGFRALEANTRTGVTSQALEARRNYMMSWTQYSREESQRAELKSQAVNNAAVMAERPKLEWTSRTVVLRKALDDLYVRFRESLRQ